MKDIYLAHVHKVDLNDVMLMDSENLFNINALNLICCNLNYDLMYCNVMNDKRIDMVDHENETILNIIVFYYFDNI